MDELVINEKKYPWSGVDLLLIFGFTYVFVYLFTFLIHTWIKPEVENVRVVLVLLSAIVQNMALFGLSFWLLRVKYRYPMFKKLFTYEKLLPVLLNGFLGGIAILFSVGIINRLIMLIFRFEPPQQEATKLLLETKTFGLFLAYAFIIAIVAPIVEETFFRGLVFNYFKEKYGLNAGYIISSSLFGLAHQSLWVFIGTFLGGLGLAYLYEKSKSLWTSIFAHMAWNGTVVLIMYAAWSLGISV